MEAAAEASQLSDEIRRKGHGALVMPLSVHTHASYATATRSTPEPFFKELLFLAISFSHPRAKNALSLLEVMSSSMQNLSDEMSSVFKSKSLPIQPHKI